jgi:tRNA pseudouridine55 synthase
MQRSLVHGLLVLDKPGGITSRDTVDRAQHWFPRGTRIGHTGTLDPLATGVLVVCVGQATRLTEYVQRMPKTYRADLQLGARSDTDDADGAVTPAPVAEPPDRHTVLAVLAQFIGEIDQVPPAHSAAKVAGRRAYDLARRGEEVTLQARRVSIHGIDVVEYAYPRLTVEVRCGKGTYIRSLARDLGERLGCGALVQTLRRTRVGPFDEGQAVALGVDAATARARLLPVAAAVSELPRVTPPAAELVRVAQGQSIPLIDDPEPAGGDEVAVCDSHGRLAAIAAVDRAARLLRPVKVLSR